MILYVSVKPNAREEKIEKISDNEYKISLKEKAEKGKANHKLITILSKEFNISQKQIKIKTPLSRKKIIEILY